jgi:uncharacterized protein
VKLRLALAAAGAIAWAAPAIAADFTIPPTPDHYVTDNAGVLSSGTRASLENELHAYQSATGHQIVVWIGQTTGDVPLETWTGETADHWKIGRRGHDDGAVLFLFMQDRKIRIEVGYGLESSLTDADSFHIIHDVITPRMRAGDVDGAVTDGVAAMLTTVSPSYKNVTRPPRASSGEEGSGIDTAALIIIIAVVVLFIGLPLVFQLIIMARVGHLVTRHGTRGALWGGVFSGGSGWGGGGFGGFGGGGFSAGGGGFGGGGASGGW